MKKELSSFEEWLKARGHHNRRQVDESIFIENISGMYLSCAIDYLTQLKNKYGDLEYCADAGGYERVNTQLILTREESDEEYEDRLYNLRYKYGLEVKRAKEAKAQQNKEYQMKLAKLKKEYGVD